MDGTTPAHVVRRESGVEKIVVKVATRAVKFEEKLRGLEGGLRRGCVRLIDLKRRDTRAERETLEFLESRGWSEQEWERRREERLETWRESERVSRDIGIQETEVQIRESRYAEDSKRLLLEERRPKYLEGVKDRKKKEIERIARFRLGCESRGCRYWMEEEGQKLRVWGE